MPKKSSFRLQISTKSPKNMTFFRFGVLHVCVINSIKNIKNLTRFVQDTKKYFIFANVEATFLLNKPTKLER